MWGCELWKLYQLHRGRICTHEDGARHGGEPGELPGYGQDAVMGGRPGNRSLSIAAICRTEPAEVTGGRGEPFEE